MPGRHSSAIRTSRVCESLAPGYFATRVATLDESLHGGVARRHKARYSGRDVHDPVCVPAPMMFDIVYCVYTKKRVRYTVWVVRQRV